MQVDPASITAGYFSPERLVSTEWLSGNLGQRSLRLLEANDDNQVYDSGHIPTAAKIDWRSELSMPFTHDVLDSARLSILLGSKGISRNDTIVVYGDKNNRWAAYVVWVLTLYGHPDVRLLNGGRNAWLAEGRETTLDFPRYPHVEYPVIKRDDEPHRIFRDQLVRSLGRTSIIDVRSPHEYAGLRLPLSEYPQERSSRQGHIPSAVNIPWEAAITPSGIFESIENLHTHYSPCVQDKRGAIVTYCQIGERSALAWFTLKFLLGMQNVRHYDGGWSEWGNTVTASVSVGTEPGNC